MKSKLRVLQRVFYAVMATTLVIGMGTSLFHSGSASAQQLATRSITLSDSAASGGTITTGVGSGTNVTYKVAFTTSAAAQSLVIDFCSNDPIIADTCTAPAGMSVTGAALTGVTGNIAGPNWTVTTPSASQVKMSGSTATSVGAQVFDLTGITNPSTLSSSGDPNGASFYARIYTFANASYENSSGTGAYVNAGSPGSYTDYGGVAMSVTQTITITARVQESLEFCVSGSAQSSWTTDYNCNDPSAATAPALILGHGTPTATLDSTVVDTGTVYSQLSTNATDGAVIYMRSDNSVCGGLSADNDATCQIPASGTTPVAIVAGTAAFGMFAAASSDESGGTVPGSGSMTIAGPYDGGTVGTTLPNVGYGMDTTTGTGVTGTFGSEVASIAGPCYEVNDAYTFGATASLTTPAGIYTDDLSMIATGTF
jgi:hypothetical protein